jgi:hypothetical protein
LKEEEEEEEEAYLYRDSMGDEVDHMNHRGLITTPRTIT